MPIVGEKWIVVPWNENYEVSNLGRVRVERRVVRYRDGRVYVYPARVLDTWETGPTETSVTLFPREFGGRYLCVTVGNKSWRLNRLILTVFGREPPFPEAEARHLDGDKYNNRPENLCWGTRRENIDDTIRHGRTTKGERHPGVKVTEETVRCIRRLRAEGLTTVEIGRRVGLSQNHVSGICNRRYWRHVV